jgi:hypothetical protein
MADPYEPETLSEVMADAARRGFTEHFTLTRGRLRAVQHDALFGPEQVTITETHRFEGVSDPDDMSILYEICTRSGVCGTLADAYGVYSDPSVGAFMHDVTRKARTPR